jgi:hypothetical protein
MKMIVLHSGSMSVGRMTRSSRQEVEIQPADTFALRQFGEWRFAQDHQVFPRHELRFFISRDAALKALKQLQRID